MINKEFWKEKKVLVTGHTGFKGSWLTTMLLELDANVTGISLAPYTKPAMFEALKLAEKITHYETDIRDYEAIKKIFVKTQPEIVIHLAAQPIVRLSYDDPLWTYTTNTIGTANILQAIKETNTNKVRSAVFITTDKVYENKEKEIAYKEDDELGGYDPYSASKACAELIIKSYRRAFKIPVASARAGNVIGGGDWSQDRIIVDIIRAVFEQKEKVVLRRPEAIRPWQHALEPLTGYLLLAEKQWGEQGGEAWNFAPLKENCISVEALTKLGLETISMGEYDVERDDAKHEATLLMLDSSKAEKELGWKQQLNINEAIIWTFDWYKKYYAGKDMYAFTKKQIEDFLKETK
ncbi:CDP-glucose 4,6-dehydratase [Candidatus Woesearchaeota archaeon]|nr:CDP-glucose 4,6-dehydratase [Candidatus Woesearchaeota archaeon]